MARGLLDYIENTEFEAVCPTECFPELLEFVASRETLLNLDLKAALTIIKIADFALERKPKALDHLVETFAEYTTELIGYLEHLGEKVSYDARRDIPTLYTYLADFLWREYMLPSGELKTGKESIDTTLKAIKLFPIKHIDTREQLTSGVADRAVIFGNNHRSLEYLEKAYTLRLEGAIKFGSTIEKAIYWHFYAGEAALNSFRVNQDTEWAEKAYIEYEHSFNLAEKINPKYSKKSALKMGDTALILTALESESWKPKILEFYGRYIELCRHDSLNIPPINRVIEKVMRNIPGMGHETIKRNVLAGNWRMGQYLTPS